MMPTSIVYVLINEAMPGYVKVGLTTTSLEQRMRELDTTSVPLPFECFYAARVADAARTEKLLHDAFLDSRVRSNREFFRSAPERIMSALKLAELEDVTPKRDYVESAEDQRVLNEARARRAAFNFAMVGIPVGAELHFVHDEHSTAVVADEKRIVMQGEVTSISAAAQKLLGYENRVAGTLYWMYEGETLDERRRRMEGEGE